MNLHFKGQEGPDETGLFCLGQNRTQWGGRGQKKRGSLCCFSCSTSPGSLQVTHEQTLLLGCAPVLGRKVADGVCVLLSSKEAGGKQASCCLSF